MDKLSWLGLSYSQRQGGLWEGVCPQGALRVQLGLRLRLGWPLLAMELTHHQA